MFVTALYFTIFWLCRGIIIAWAKSMKKVQCSNLSIYLLCMSAEKQHFSIL